jgi:hypothetical protein
VEYAAISPRELAMRQRELDRASSLPPTLPTNYIGLLSAIRSAGSLDQLETLCTSEQTAPFFDTVHFSAALSRLPKLMRFRSKDLDKTDVVLTSSLSPPESHISQGLHPRSEAGPLTLAPGSAPRPGYSQRASALTFHLLSSLTRTQRHQKPGVRSPIFPRQSANCIWALGTLHSMGVPVIDEPKGNTRRKRSGMKKLPPSYPSHLLASPGVENPLNTLEALVERMQGSDMVSEYERAGNHPSFLPSFRPASFNKRHPSLYSN